MSKLNEKLQEIKRQKDEYIRPENLKKDVTVYGVTGTLESGSGGVKLFDTEEHMQQDTTAQEGDFSWIRFKALRIWPGNQLISRIVAIHE